MMTILWFLGLLNPVPTPDPLEDWEDIVRQTRDTLRAPTNEGTVAWARKVRDQADLAAELRAELDNLKAGLP